MQVVSRDGTDIDELPRVGTKRSVKERLGNQFDSSSYGSDAVSKRYFLFPSYVCIESKELLNLLLMKVRPFVWIHGVGKDGLCFVFFLDFMQSLRIDTVFSLLCFV